MPRSLANQDFVGTDNECGNDVFQATGSWLEKAINWQLAKTIKTLPLMTLFKLIVSDESDYLWEPLLYPVPLNLVFMWRAQ